jgi:23S rRNA (cytidine1920-2'-O)/16S rRNA (cytidine1409-2'-O)-methyltransferase
MANAPGGCANSPNFLWRAGREVGRVPQLPMKVKQPSPSAAPGNRKPGKKRLDVLIVERGLAPSRERAQAMLLAGQVQVNSQRAEKAGTQILEDARIEIIGETQRYSSRGGFKLEGALKDFNVIAQDKVCADIGSSTGGFTDCLLQKEAKKVYAVDVTIDQLDWKLRQDSRVIQVKSNARYLRPEDIGEPAELITVDVSFISVTKILPSIVAIAKACADFLILIKPQFELEKREVGKGGIVRDAQLHQKAIDRVVAAAGDAGLQIDAVRPSCLPGTEGNQEFFLHARKSRLD